MIKVNSLAEQIWLYLLTVSLIRFLRFISFQERVTAMNSVSVTLAFHVASDCSAINQCRINVKCLVSWMRVSKQAMHELWMPVTDT